MGEIYQERLKVYPKGYMGRMEALRDAIEISVGNQFTSEQKRANLIELSEIAKEEGIADDYRTRVTSRIFSGEINGKDF